MSITGDPSRLAEEFPEMTRTLAGQRPLLESALVGDTSELARSLLDEQEQEKELDRQYWTPLIEELEQWRLNARGE